MNAIHLDTIIYGKTEEQAIEHMEHLVENSNELVMGRTINSIYTDKSRYRAEYLGNHCRGYRYMKMYISRDLLLDEEYSELFIEVAMPKLVNQSYYDSTRFGEPYNWMEHVYIY